MSDTERYAYNRSALMDLADSLPEFPGVDMLVNLPESEAIVDIRLAEVQGKQDGEGKGPVRRGLLCTTGERLLFFLRIPEAAADAELTTATGYLVESLLRRRPLDRKQAARYFPKKEAAILKLRRRMAELYLPDLMPILCLPLAAIPALLAHLDASRQAVVDLELDLRGEGGRLAKLISVNPQLRFILGPRFTEKPYPTPDPKLPLVNACPPGEMVGLVEQVRDLQTEIDYDRLPAQLFASPWATSLLSCSPQAKIDVVHKGNKVSGKLFFEKGLAYLARKLSRNELFNVGDITEVTWNEEPGVLTVRGQGMHYNLAGEANSAQFAWLRSYLLELMDVRSSIWEDPTAQIDFEPEDKPDPAGELLRYHLEPCNDPHVLLKEHLDQEMVDTFMDGFGQLIAPDESPQCLIHLTGANHGQEGLLFTDRALYVRRYRESGQRIPHRQLPGTAKSKKGLLSTSLSFGLLTLKLDSLGKETSKALREAIRAIGDRAN